MKKNEVLRNKMFLGCLTLSDLISHKIIRFEQDSCEFSVGKNWLPVVRTRIRKHSGVRHLQIFMDSCETDCDLEIRLDCFLKIKENLILISGEEIQLKFEKNIFEILI